MKIPRAVNLIAIIIGIIIIIEGLALLNLAAPMKVDGIGWIKETTVSLGGLQLFVLGLLFIVSFWLRKRDWGMGKRRELLSLFFTILPFLIATVIAVEGIVIASMAGAVQWEGIGGIRKFWVGAAGCQLFVLGVGGLLTSRFADTPLRTIGLTRILGIIVSTALAAEGLFVISIAGRTSIEGIGGIRESTFTYAGIQLLVLALILLCAWSLKDGAIAIKGRKISGQRAVRILSVVISIIIAIEGIILAIKCGRMTIDGIGGILERTVVASGAQLFALGLLSASLWILSKENLLRTRFAEIISIVASIAIASEGLLVMGLASPANVQSIGGITASTVNTAGTQLLVLGIVALIAWLVRNFASDILSERPIIAKIASYTIIVVVFVVAVESLFVMNFASVTTIRSVGTLMANTILIGGVQLFILAIVQPIVLMMPFISADAKTFKTAFAVSLFLVLMVPPALIF
ncbi:MAG: hypothetical protein QHH00_04120 [Methanomassiliicoccales archaeon]|nr:hypothetical protein [Methanomassiliicoccales archaeon]